MSLSSSSTLVEVQNAYDDNASYAEDGDVAKAKAFITACRILLRRMPGESGTREQHFKMNPELIQKEMEAAQQFVAANDTANGTGGGASSNGPKVIHSDFRNFRG
jgi:hypothetical protein